MAAQKKQQPQTIEQPMYGFQDGRNTRCLLCHKLIGYGEQWRRVISPDGSYAVAVHDACRVARGFPLTLAGDA